MEQNKENIKSDIRKFIIKNYLKSRTAPLSDNDSFLEQGIIDSIGVIELANFIQAKFAIRVNVVDIVPDNFDTLNNLEKYVSRKLTSKK
jgi:acyl carrier protein